VSNFTGPAYHPKEKTVRAASFMDDYFGKHEYGVRFSGDHHVYKEHETRIPLDVVFVPKPTDK
jgi:hypothetical protein